MSNRELRPKARAENLVVEEVLEEVLVYDLERDKAHCLNAAAAHVWRAADGTKSVEQISASLHERLGFPRDEAIVRLALRELADARLLDEPNVIAREAGVTSRRDALKRIGLVGGLALALPLVKSVVAPTAVAAVTCAEPGQACSALLPCCIGTCSGGVCPGGTS